MFYRVKDGQVYDYADYKYTDNCLKTNICTMKEYFEHSDRYIIKNDVILLDPEYEQKQQKAEEERVRQLTVTKRVFALALQKFGITYTQIKELIATNEQAQLEWDLCVELERSNPLLDKMASRLDITSEQLDYIFKAANGEEV